MLNQIAVISLMAVFSGCPTRVQTPVNYVNTYLIPQGYHGWLIVRNKPGGKPRPAEVVYQFDGRGFCTSDIDVGTNLFATHYFYVDPSGQKTEIPQGKDLNQPNVDTVLGWFRWSTATATSDEFLGERWDIYFVGTPAEYESAKQNFGTFMNHFNLYKTVTVTKN